MNFHVSFTHLILILLLFLVLIYLVAFFKLFIITIWFYIEGKKIKIKEEAKRKMRKRIVRDMLEQSRRNMKMIKSIYLSLLSNSWMILLYSTSTFPSRSPSLFLITLLYHPLLSLILVSLLTNSYFILSSPFLIKDRLPSYSISLFPSLSLSLTHTLYLLISLSFSDSLSQFLLSLLETELT